MVIEQLVLKEKSPYLFKDSVFLKDFSEMKLKIATHVVLIKLFIMFIIAKNQLKLILCT